MAYNQPDSNVKGWFSAHHLPWSEEIEKKLFDGQGVQFVEDLKLLKQSAIDDLFGNLKPVVKSRVELALEELRERNTIKRKRAAADPINENLTPAERASIYAEGQATRKQKTERASLDVLVKSWAKAGQQDNRTRLNIYHALKHHTMAGIARHIRFEIYSSKSDPWDGVGKHDRQFDKIRAVIGRVTKGIKDGTMKDLIDNNTTNPHLYAKSIKANARGKKTGQKTGNTPTVKKENHKTSTNLALGPEDSQTPQNENENELDAPSPDGMHQNETSENEDGSEPGTPLPEATHETSENENELGTLLQEGLKRYTPQLSKIMSNNHIRVLTMGGTIDKDYPRLTSGYAFEFGEESAASRILNAHPNLGVSFDATSICKKDSSEMFARERELLLNAISNISAEMTLSSPHHARIVVTHGTDTMVETARYIQDRIGDKCNAVIAFTGATKPERFVDSDASFNVGLAVGATSACGPGSVVICMNGNVLPAENCVRDEDSGLFIWG